MKKVLYSFVSGLITTIMLAYIIFRNGGSKIDPKKLEKIRKDVKNKPLKSVINDVNEWLS